MGELLTHWHVGTFKRLKVGRLEGGQRILSRITRIIEAQGGVGEH